MIGEKAGKITPNGDVPPGREKIVENFENEIKQFITMRSCDTCRLI
jgi:hypothetical protein